MNIKQYLDNPMGKGAIIPGKQIIIEDYNRRYNELLKKSKFNISIYKDKNDYIIHILVPTESDERDNTYDVVLHFSPSKITNKADGTIENYNMKIFSNCPSFTYTYAYAYKLNGHMIDYLEKKYENEILSRPPLMKNPNNMVNYEKSVYFACKYLLSEKHLLSKTYLNNGKKINKKAFTKSIRSNYTIELEIKRQKAILKEEKRKSKEDNKRTENKIKGNKSSVNLIKPTKSTVSTKSKSSVNKVSPKSSTLKQSGVRRIKAKKR